MLCWRTRTLDNAACVLASVFFKACAAAGDASGAERVFGEMQQRDNHFVKYTAPDSRSFHHLMTVQMERGDAGRVLELAAEMRARGVARTEGHYELALRAAGLHGWHQPMQRAVGAWAARRARSPGAAPRS